jgi:hypothetical protein
VELFEAPFEEEPPREDLLADFLLALLEPPREDDPLREDLLALLLEDLDADFLDAPFFAAAFLDPPFFAAAFLGADFLDALFFDEPPLPEEEPPRLEDFLEAPFLDAPFFDLPPPEDLLPPFFPAAAFLVDFAIVNGFCLRLKEFLFEITMM